MSLPGPLPLPPIQAQDLTNLSLQVQERITAEVLQVAGERVYLSIDGVQVVARLTSSDQAARLMERRKAKFIVKEHSAREILLQLVGSSEAEQPSPAGEVALIPELLVRAGLEADPLNKLLAELLLSRGIPIDREVIQAVREFLERYQRTDQQEISTAVAVLIRGLQLSPGAVDLVQDSLPQLAEILESLLQQLRKKASQEKHPLRYYLSQAANQLEAMLIPAGGPKEEISANLQRALPMLANSIESQLAALIKEARSPLDQALEKRGMLSAAALLGLEKNKQGGAGDLQGLLRTCLNRLRMTQFVNSAASSPDQQPQRLQIELPLVMAQTPREGRPKNALLRIHSRQEAHTGKLDAGQIQLKLIIELAAEEVLSIEITIVGKRIQGQVSSSNSRLQQAAEQEIELFKHSLEEEGYTLHELQCTTDLGLKLPVSPLENTPAGDSDGSSLPWKKLNVEA